MTRSTLKGWVKARKSSRSSWTWVEKGHANHVSKPVSRVSTHNLNPIRIHPSWSGEIHNNCTKSQLMRWAPRNSTTNSMAAMTAIRSLFFRREITGRDSLWMWRLRMLRRTCWGERWRGCWRSRGYKSGFTKIIHKESCPNAHGLLPTYMKYIQIHPCWWFTCLGLWTKRVSPKQRKEMRYLIEVLARKMGLSAQRPDQIIDWNALCIVQKWSVSDLAYFL